MLLTLPMAMALWWLVALGCTTARADSGDVLPGIADYQLIDAYEELVASVTKMTPLGLEDLPQRCWAKEVDAFLTRPWCQHACDKKGDSLLMSTKT